MSDLSIREARAGDLEAIIRLLRGCGYRFVTFDELAEIMENA